MTAGPARSPRVVMLVDNTVDGDSRVQKSARRMAELGWDVTLIGRSPSARETTERLGDATLLRVATTQALNTHRRRSPGHTLRFPLAYPDRDTLAAAETRAAWRHLDLQTRLATGSGPGLLVARLVAKAQRVLNRERARQYRSATRRAAAPSGRAGLRLRPPSRQWSYDDPFLADLEVAVAPALARLKPDLVHAHDYRSIGIAVRYKQRNRGKPVVIYDAHEFLPGIGLADARRRRGDEAYERLHLRHADGIVTVSQGVAESLQARHGVGGDAAIALNCPDAASGSWDGTEPDVRSAARVPADAPLVVYVGAAADRRGLGTVLEALAKRPAVHLVLVTKHNDYVASLERAAATAGYADRLHVLPYVAPEDVSRFVRSADVGISPLMDTVNHQLALPTKLFEYAQARLPIITSEVRGSAEAVRRHGIGEVAQIGDAEGFLVALDKVLADPAGYRRAYDETDLLQQWTWEAQSGPVDALYRRLLGRGPDETTMALRDVERSLDDGIAPPTEQVLATATALLARADAALAATDPKGAAVEAARAAAVLFHRTLHFDGESSPLAQDPDGYLACWHDSAVGVAATWRAGAERTSTRTPGQDVAILSYANMDFVGPLERTLSRLGRTHRRLDLTKIAEGKVPLSPLQQVRARLTHADTSPWEPALLDALGSSDTLWVEWGQRAAVVASTLTDPSRRRIVRLHSFEAFTAFPHLVDWSAVDDLVFVGPHVRDLVVPRLRGFDPATTRTHVIPIGVDAAAWRRPKQEGAERTLAVIGWAAPAKDARWAVELLARLRAHDPSYRLVLVGREPAADGPAGVRRYREAVLDRIAQPDVAGAVELVPFTTDVPGLLERVGVLVSSSVRESLHMTVIEGAASGAVPVVRDWPMLAAYDGPRRIYPADWVVTDLDAAAERVLGLPTGAALADLRTAVADEAARRFDDTVVEARLREMLDT